MRVRAARPGAGEAHEDSDRDRADLEAIAAGPGLHVATLKSRYREELRHMLARPEREDLTLDLWTEIIEELEQRR